MGHRTCGVGGMSIFTIISNTHPHNLFFLGASHRIPVTTARVGHWVDEARAEVQDLTIPNVRTGNPIAAVRRHAAQRTGMVVAIAAGREEDRIPLFIRLSIKMPSFIKHSIDVIFSRITCIPSCCAESSESIGSQHGISYGRGVVYSLNYLIIIGINPIIIRTPQIIIHSVHLILDIELMRITDNGP